MRRARVILIVVVVISAFLVGGGILAWRLISTSETGLVLLGNTGLLSSSQLVSNLSSPDVNIVRESIGILNRRRDPAGINAALPLLQSKDDYVWLNTSIYLGNQGRAEAVPYLIKGLRHTAWRAQPDMVAALKALTGKDFGNDFSMWQEWWLKAHPGTTFDFESHLGPFPRIPPTTNALTP